MADLVFHIGLTKCASSTLQRKVFQNEEGYLGTVPRMVKSDNLAKQLQNCTPLGGRQTTSTRGLNRWLDRVHDVQKRDYPNARRLILSNENFSSASRFHDRPMLSVFSMIRERISTKGRIKVVVVLRTQAARMASGYAHGTCWRYNPGQAEFEKLVSRRLKSRRSLRLLDYSRWVHGLEEVIGPENLCILFLEEANTLAFWTQLADFCQLEQFDPESMLSKEGANENVRRLDGQCWAIGEFDPNFRARARVNKWMNAFWPTHINSGRREQVRKQTIERLAAFYGRRASELSGGERERQFALTPRVMDLVRRYTGPFNKNLSEKLGKDLRPLGY